MAKISELANGGVILETDELVALRAGGNVRVKVDGMATQDASNVTITGGSISGLSSLDVTGTVTADGLTVDDVVSIDTSTGNAFSSTGNLKIDIDSDNNQTDRTFQITSDGRSKTLFQAEEGGDISFYEDTGTTAKFFWDASAERLGLGTTSALADLHIVNSAAAQFLLEAGDSSTATMLFGDSADTNIGWIQYDNSDNNMNFRTNNAEAMRIDSSGNLLVGTTDSSPFDSSTEQGAVISDGQAQIAGTSTPLYLNRQASDGNLVDFRKDGVPVGSIGVKNSDLTVGSGNTGLRFTDSTSQIWAVDTTDGSSRDAAVDLGNPTVRFKDLYLAEGISLSADDAGGVGSNTIGFKHTGHTAGYSAAIEASYSGDFRANLIFKVNTSQSNTAPIEVARFNNGGNLLVSYTGTGTPGNGNTDTGHLLKSDGRFFSSSASNSQFNRNSDGDILTFRESGDLVGSIGVYNGVPYIGYSEGTGGGIMFNGKSIEPTAVGSSRTDGENDIGGNFYRWKDLHLAGGVIFDENPTIVSTTVGARTIGSKTLDDYEEGTWTPVYDSVSGLTNVTGLSDIDARYTKVGNTVQAHFTYKLTNSGSETITAGDYFTITSASLPFAPHTYVTSGSIDQFIGDHVWYQSIGTNNIASGSVLWGTGGTYLNFGVVNGTPDTGTSAYGLVRLQYDIS